MQRLLVPALYNLSCWGLLPDRFAILGIGRTERTADQFRDEVAEAAKRFAQHRSIDDTVLKRLTRRADYLAGDVRDAAIYNELGKRLEHLRGDTGGNVLFYLAIVPELFGPIVRHLGNAGLLHEGGFWRRVIIEKPFGSDLASARRLNTEILGVLDESQIYRIDHFLGKETVQNILAFRFANGFFEPMWDRDHIDHIQITVAETVGVEQRAGFYDHTGALRDMVPNHLFQLMAMTAMEPPISFDADEVRSKKDDVLRAIHPLSPADVERHVVRGQYDAGRSGNGPLAAYRDEPRVDQGSTTETFVAMRLMLDNWRWAGVPFYLRTGKRLSRRTTEIAIRFKPAPYLLFRDTPVDKIAADWMVLRIQPDEGIALEFNAKVPGPSVRLERVHMNFLYKDYFRVSPSTGYETLIYDAMMGDPMLFQRADNIETGWGVVQPILDAWSGKTPGDPPVDFYPAGSDGPAAADELLTRDGRTWRPINGPHR